jgi:glycosyltransferase involved in cell wall biosynthesis
LTAKKNILILCDWFLPGYLAGGPIQSIATLTQHLGNDVHFKIITTDRDFHSNTAYKNIEIDTWTVFEGREVFYVSPENMNPEFILQLITTTTHDKLYLNSLFSRFFTVYPLKWKQQGKISSEIILAPRGMLGDGALAIKPLKKKLFLISAACFGLFKEVKWQSTSAQETAEIKKRIGKDAAVFEISNLPKPAGPLKSLDKEKGLLNLCFISRISEKKNLNFAIDVLKEVKDLHIRFDVYGPVEDDAYWNNCLHNSTQLPAGIIFGYKGSLKPEEIGATVNNYHALFLPTQNENYGHIIVETLQQNRPVILSDQTPWRDLQKEGVGFDLSLYTKSDFVKAVISLAQLNCKEFEVMSHACSTYIHKQLNIEAIKAAYIKLFNA